MHEFRLGSGLGAETDARATRLIVRVARAARNFQPALDTGRPYFEIVCDRDGYSLLRKIRALPASAGGETPAAAITAFAYAEDRQRALDAGFQLHIAKPVDVDELAVAVLQLAEMSTVHEA